MSVVTFIILSLATWRISSLLVNEPGPWHIFTKIRKLTGLQHDENDKVYQIPDRFFAGILSCVWCTSIYIGAFWAILWIFIPQITIYLGVLFALSAAAIIIEKYTAR